MTLTITYIRNVQESKWSAVVEEIPDIVVEGETKKECRNRIFKALPYNIHLIEIEHQNTLENDTQPDIED